MKETIEFNLKERLIDFAVRIIKLSEALPNTRAGQHICGQVLRSGTAAASNYGEAQGAESRADFIHKVKIALKELRETEVWLKIIVKSGIVIPATKLDPLLKETDELISILFTSVSTAKKNIQHSTRNIQRSSLENLE